MEDELPRQGGILKSLASMLTMKNTLAVYRDFYEKIGKKELFVMADKKTLEWADVYPFLYLHAAFEAVSYTHLQEINLRSPSQHFFMNQYYFSSFFKQKTGKNFKDYLVEVRMQKALELLLENSGMSTQELARKVGYNDAKSFSEKFRQYYGESPVNYKKINKM